MEIIHSFANTVNLNIARNSVVKEQFRLNIRRMDVRVCVCKSMNHIFYIHFMDYCNTFLLLSQSSSLMNGTFRIIALISEYFSSHLSLSNVELFVI